MSPCKPTKGAIHLTYYWKKQLVVDKANEWQCGRLIVAYNDIL
jgi:hypothetical protein